MINKKQKTKYLRNYFIIDQKNGREIFRFQDTIIYKEEIGKFYIVKRNYGKYFMFSSQWISNKELEQIDNWNIILFNRREEAVKKIWELLKIIQTKQPKEKLNKCSEKRIYTNREKEYHREYYQKYYKKNKIKLLNYGKKYFKKNQDKILKKT